MSIGATDLFRTNMVCNIHVVQYDVRQMTSTVYPAVPADDIDGLPYYRVATVSRIDKILGLFLQNIVSFIGLFCKRDL